MNDIRKKGQETLLLSIIGIAAGISFIGGAAFSEYNANAFDSNTVYKTVSADIVPAGIGEEGKTLGFDEYKIVYDENDYTYSYAFDSYAGLDDSFFEVKYGSEKNKINLIRHYIDKDKEDIRTLEFDKDVVDSFVAAFGDSNEKDSIFFILEDGSIEYILMGRAVKNDDFRSFKINGLKNIAKHYNSNACSDVNGTCLRTVLVQSTDGTIYNLMNYIQ